VCYRAFPARIKVIRKSFSVWKMQMNALKVQSFAPRHQDGVVAVILSIQQLEFGIPITLEAQPDLRNIPGFYQQGDGNFWVAEVEGRVVGTIALLDIGHRQAALRKMFVAAEYRGAEHGIAKRLLETLIEWATRRGLAEIFLGTTAAFLAAHRFYEKNGFTEIPQSALPLAFPIMSVDTKFYSLELSRLG
jgi:GNAT superfamily N-acetyltransferase